MNAFRYVQYTDFFDNGMSLVGACQTDPSSGLFTNAFLVEPRLYGLTVGVSL